MSPLPEDSGRPIAVIGGGTLGRRIALMLACAGGTVRVCDPSAVSREQTRRFVDEHLQSTATTVDGGEPGTVELTADLAEAVASAWLVVESLPERLDLKIEMFGELDRLAPTDAILATNSSSHPSSRMVERVSRPERVVNLHFFMPPAVTACELMTCGSTDASVLDRMMTSLPRFGLQPFRVQRESMGFIHNRIWAAIKREALMVLDEGVASPSEVDALYKSVLGARTGPFEGMDRVGLDVVLDIEENYAAHRDGLPEGPRDLLLRMIDDGRLGRKSGRGFYDYDTRETT